MPTSKTNKRKHHALLFPNQTYQNNFVCNQVSQKYFHRKNRKRNSDVSSHKNTSHWRAVTRSMDLCWMCAGVDSHNCGVCSGSGTQALCAGNGSSWHFSYHHIIFSGDHSRIRREFRTFPWKAGARSETSSRAAFKQGGRKWWCVVAREVFIFCAQLKKRDRCNCSLFGRMLPVVLLWFNPSL